ncbi:glycosyltransferase family A protein [Paenibacillus sp. NPDC057934]|uniref:glycosyltransferase family A protein n=1 Tax=Paenibacillus sp. NPDC057934 TaxID=3346282 RepID=UPI0036DF54E0
MVAQLIWIAAVYSSAVALVHVLHIREKSRQARESGKWIQYILITRNHESVVEWYIRALTFHAFLTGKPLRVLVMDDNSSDTTMGIVSRMARSGCSLDMATAVPALGQEEMSKSQGIILDLRLSGQTVRWPMMQVDGSRGSKSKHGDI